MATSKKITLNDIAKRAKVSTAIVSCILNGKGRASEAVRTRVLGMLEEAGYKPKHTRHSFYLLADLDRIAESGKAIPFMRMLKGIEGPLDDEGVHLQVEFISSSLADNGISLSAQFETILQRQPGAVFIPTDESWLEKACSFFAKASVPFIQIGYDTEVARYPAVVVDSFAGGFAAAQHLIARGHRSPGIIRWQYSLAGINSGRKFAGFKTALGDAGIELPPSMVKSVTIGQDSPHWNPVRTLLDSMLSQPHRASAVFIDNSFLSLPLLYPIAGDKGEVPKQYRDLDMVHFEDWPLDPVEDIVSSKLFYPARDVTLLAIDWEGIGRFAARMLIDRVRNISGADTPTVRIAPLLQRVKGNVRETISPDTIKGDTP